MDTENVKKKHLSAFNWNNGRIPLAIKVEDMSSYKGIRYDDKDFVKRLFEKQLENLNDSVEVGSDIIPTLPILNYGTGIAPSLLGADISLEEKEYERALLFGFIVKNIFNSVKDVKKYSICNGKRFLSDVVKHFDYFVENAPEGIYVSGSPEDPFDVANILRGSGIFLDLYDNPQEIHELMELSTQLVIETERQLRTITGHYRDGRINECPSLDGLWFDGIRIAGDSLIMISEQMIREFVRPYYEKMAKAFGCRLYIHFCSGNQMEGEAILDAFLDCDDVVGLSTQYGLELFERRYINIKGKMMFDTCYGGAHEYYIEKHGGIKNWARHLKDSYGEYSGLIINAKVSSKNEGKRLWEEWNEVWESS